MLFHIFWPPKLVEIYNFPLSPIGYMHGPQFKKLLIELIEGKKTTKTNDSTEKKQSMHNVQCCFSIQFYMRLSHIRHLNKIRML